MYPLHSCMCKIRDQISSAYANVTRTASTTFTVMSLCRMYNMKALMAGVQ